MLQKSDELARLLAESQGADAEDPFLIVPMPDLDALRRAGSAAVDLRLGRWFINTKPTRLTHLEADSSSRQFTKTSYVPFGREYVLHPRSFVLAVTLEWLRLPAMYAAYVTAKSSWGRVGLIIATATGVHPGFKGCLTLELSNMGDVPIKIKPGTQVCQLFIHQVNGAPDHVDQTDFVGRRRPVLGQIKLDEIARRLGQGGRIPGLQGK